MTEQKYRRRSAADLTNFCIRSKNNKVVDHLAALSATSAEEKYFASMSYAFEIWNHLMMSGDCPKFIDVLKNSGSSIGNPVLEVLKWGTGQSKHTLPAVCLAVGEKYLPPKESEVSQRRLGETRRR